MLLFALSMCSRMPAEMGPWSRLNGVDYEQRRPGKPGNGESTRSQAVALGLTLLKGVVRMDRAQWCQRALLLPAAASPNLTIPTP